MPMITPRALHRRVHRLPPHGRPQAWRTLADIVRVDALPPGTGMRVHVRGTSVAVFNVGGVARAIDDLCVRCGASLAAGRLHQGDVVCAGCGWRYDIVTGRVARIPAIRIDTFDVTVVAMRVNVAPLRRTPGR